MVEKPQFRSSANAAWLRALERTSRIGERPTLTLPVLVAETAAERPDAPALISDGESLSYGELAARADRYAAWSRASGLEAGSVVGLMMSNRPEYVAIWLGLTRVGVTVALLNTNLRGAALAHCITAAGARTLIVEAAFAGSFDEVPAGLWLHGKAALDRPRIDLWIAEAAMLGDRLPPQATLDTRALYIYTSGNTGLPKAASISHHRIMQWAGWFAGMADLKPSDRTYNCLPLYHSVGGVVAVGAALVAGGSVFLREKFSARQFWREVTARECTIFQYIGELARYLLSAPPDPAETQHKLRLACGNGLRADVWEAFQTRFAIPQILEFYAATEGNFSLFNAEGQPGAIGRFPNFLPHRKGVALVKVDPATGVPDRGEDGFCVRCGTDESGETISLISGGAAARFEGYADSAATERKVLRNVFQTGDAWFRSGDLMRKDAHGFFYFVDRIGDTFRWKGENVATAEVAAVVRACPGVADADVYGVAVPGTDGKAGMVAIVPGEGFDIADLHAHVAARLPAYARPLFVRLCKDLARTATFKANTQGLQADGFDPAVVADPLFFDAPGAGCFVPLDAALHVDLTAGRVKI